MKRRNSALLALGSLLVGGILTFSPVEQAEASTQSDKCCIPGYWKTKAQADAYCDSSICWEWVDNCGLGGGAAAIWTNADCVPLPNITCTLVMSPNVDAPTFRCGQAGCITAWQTAGEQCTGLAYAAEFTVQSLRGCTAGQVWCQIINGIVVQQPEPLEADPDWYVPPEDGWWVQ